MDQYDYTDILGTKVIYKDYLGLERTALIGWAETYNGENAPEAYGGQEIIAWLYLVDDDPEKNVHEFVIGNNQRIMYAEMRLTTDVCLLEEGQA